MAMYCYFEALGAGYSDRTAEGIEPWLAANNAVLFHLALSAVLSLTLLADSRTSLSAVLRGLAPLYLNVGLAVVFATSLIPLVLFAGREFSKASEHHQLYDVASTSFLLLWVVAFGILAVGHATYPNTTKVQTLATPVGGGSGEEDGTEEEGAASFSELSGGGALTAGI